MQQMTLNSIKKQIIPILKKEGVTRAAIFGSFARGEQTQKSDIDILVELPDHATLIDLAGLKLDLEDVLKKKVDVVEYAGLKPRIKDSILQQQVQIL